MNGNRAGLDADRKLLSKLFISVARLESNKKTKKNDFRSPSISQIWKLTNLVEFLGKLKVDLA